MGKVKNSAGSEVLKSACRFKDEAEFQTWVNEVFELNGWLWYHTLRSKGSQPGFPDLCAVHADRRRMVFAELKMPKNKLSFHQEGWINALRHTDVTFGMDVGGSTFPEVYVWYPEDEDRIVAIAGGKRPAW